jgi:hypothetical protein
VVGFSVGRRGHKAALTVSTYAELLPRMRSRLPGAWRRCATSEDLQCSLRLGGADGDDVAAGQTGAAVGSGDDDGTVDAVEFAADHRAGA